MQQILKDFENYLYLEEKSKNTITKYLRDIKAFLIYINSQEITKELCIKYKLKLTKTYSPSGVNSRIAAINCFLRFLNKQNCSIKALKIQRSLFIDKSKELTFNDYQKLVCASKNKKEGLIIKTLAATGIRVGELPFITLEAVGLGFAKIQAKNKIRTIIIPDLLCDELKRYAQSNKIQKGSLFINKKGKPLDRTTIYKSLKKISKLAGVEERKVYPHNFRHLFAQIFYSSEKDIVRLADILGHSSIETTRVYTIESGKSHKACIDKLSKLFLST